MKFVSILILFTFAAIYSKSQDLNMMVREADRIESVPDEKGALNAFREVLKIKPIQLYALCKCSELCCRIGKRQADNKKKEDYYEAARIYAATALRVDSLSSDANCAMAMALGGSTMNRKGKEKIATVRDIKKYADRAIQFDPNNFKAWHVLGRWYYEISNLNLFERAAVNMFYGGLPSASIKDAIRAFERSASITSGFILNYSELAKAYHRNDENNKAVNMLNTMLSIPEHTEDDKPIKTEGRKLLEKWR